MAYYRKIHFGFEEWQYHIGRSCVHIKGPNCQTIKATPRDILGHDIDSDDKNAITPGMIKGYILIYLEEGKKNA